MSSNGLIEIAIRSTVPRLDPRDNVLIALQEKTIEQMADSILELVFQVASDDVRTKAKLRGQDDFISWKRGVSL
jgi:altronate hydrolase